MDHEARILNIPDLLNTRDLGGLPIPIGGGETRFGRIVRGPGVDSLQQPGVDALIDGLGITREIDLRDKHSGQLGPESMFGRQVDERHQISAMREDHQAEAFKRYEREFEWDHASDYLQALTSSSGVPEILGLLADDSGRPTYIHCNVGKDRTGTICGVVLSAVGVPRHAVVEDFALSERDMDEWWERAMAASEGARQFFGSANATSVRTFKSAAPEIMEKMLDGLDEKYGSSADYIRSLDNGEAILDGLRRKLVDA